MRTGSMRVGMLVVIGLVALANALGWVEPDPDLWTPLVCIIAVMGVGTRGGILDRVPFVVIEMIVVAVLGLATFSGSRDLIWASSVAVSVLAVGKIALLEAWRSSEREQTRSGEHPRVDASGTTNPGKRAASAQRSQSSESAPADKAPVNEDEDPKDPPSSQAAP